MSQIPATRSLAAVLRDAMATDPGARLLAATDNAGQVAYLLGSGSRLLYLGTTTDWIQVVTEGDTVTVPKLNAGGGSYYGSSYANYAAGAAAAAPVVINHGLGRVPVGIQVTPRTPVLGITACYVTARDANAFTVQLVTNAPPAGATQQHFDYLVMT